MRKWVWRIFVTLSAVLLAGTAGLWPLARWRAEEVTYTHAIEPSDPPARWRVTATATPRSLVLRFDHLRVTGADPAEMDDVRRLLRRRAGLSHARRAAVPLSFYDLAFERGGFGWDRRHYAADSPTGGYVILVKRDPIPADLRATTAAIPWWFLALLFALAPARALWGWRKKRRRPPHACRGCGYDLRATADPAGPRLAICPECGRASAG